MGHKTRLNTRRHLHAARLRAERENKPVRADRRPYTYGDDAMSKMLKGVDLDRYERLAARP